MAQVGQARPKSQRAEWSWPVKFRPVHTSTIGAPRKPQATQAVPGTGWRGVALRDSDRVAGR